MRHKQPAVICFYRFSFTGCQNEFPDLRARRVLDREMDFIAAASRQKNNIKIENIESQ